MTQETKWTGLKFEPHGLYGQKIDGEAMPFGYISQQGYGKPIFELSPIFVHPTEDLRALALQMAAAPEMAEALRPFAALLEIFEQKAGTRPMEGEICSWVDHRVGERVLTVEHLVAARAALQKAGG